jgi:chlorobactene glucosyltransferase
MYTNIPIKNISPSERLDVCVAMAACFIVPYLFAGFSWLLWASSEAAFFLAAFWIPLLQIARAILMRLLIALKCRLPLSDSFSLIMSIAILIAIAISSMRWIYFQEGAEWKGRRYDFSKS